MIPKSPTKTTDLFHPETVELSAPELESWNTRPDVHIYRLDVMHRQARYVALLLWLDGRELYIASQPTK